MASTKRLALTLGVLVLGLTGCTALLPASDELGDGGAALDTPLPDDAPTADVPTSSGCSVPPEERPVITHGASGAEEAITTDTTWSCGFLHVLAGNVVVSGARLTIQAGTEVRGESGTFVLVGRDAQLFSQGTMSDPVVLTSARPPGSRAAADWRGLVLLGGARTHTANLTVDQTLETSDLRGRFGGGPSAAPSGSCGELTYTRIEFAGGAGGVTDAPSSGVTLAGCGRDTLVDHLQVNRSTDGIGLVGGSPLLTHIVASRSVNQGIEWTGGFTGSLQFVVVFHPASAATGVAVRGSNSAASPAATPISRPEMFNMTLVGAGSLVSGEEMGVQFSFGSLGEIRNSIITGFPSYAVDVRWPAASEFSNGTLRVTHGIVFGNGADLGQQLPGAGVEDDDSTNDDASFDENTELLRASENNAVRDPGLSSRVTMDPPIFHSNFAAIADGPDAVPRDSRLLATDYSGAFLREATGNPAGWTWTDGWTRYPLD